MFLRGIRGATTVTENTSQNILDETKNLLTKLIEENQLIIDDIASIFFSVTSDLNAEFPAKAAREMGLEHTPLLCMTEIPVPNSLAKCIRILIHMNTTKNIHELKHIYLKNATTLRPSPK
jgi:chorismate mutase